MWLDRCWECHPWKFPREGLGEWTTWMGVQWSAGILRQPRRANLEDRRGAGGAPSRRCCASGTQGQAPTHPHHETHPHYETHPPVGLSRARRVRSLLPSSSVDMTIEFGWWGWRGGGSVQIRHERCSPARRRSPDPYDYNDSEGACWEERGVCADFGHLGSQAPTNRPDAVSRPRPSVCRLAPCPIGWDIFDDEPGPPPSRERRPARPGPRPSPADGRPGPAVGHAGDVRGLGLGHLDR